MPSPHRELLEYSYRKSIGQIRQRQASMLWWLKQREAYPLGMVPIGTAARMLGISRCRCHNLVSTGRLKIVSGMPGGTRLDRFIPIEALFTAPFRANRGRPGLYGRKERCGQPKILNTGASPSGTHSILPKP